jgi:hypothetical protein
MQIFNISLKTFRQWSFYEFNPVFSSPAEKKLRHVRDWLKRPPRALPPCFLAWVKSLPENEKETLRKFTILLVFPFHFRANFQYKSENI